jgi:hypothetical protein
VTQTNRSPYDEGGFGHESRRGLSIREGKEMRDEGGVDGGLKLCSVRVRVGGVVDADMFSFLKRRKASGVETSLLLLVLE